MLNDDIKTIPILVESNKNIFSSDRYIIPLYQRAFAWEDKEIEQLVDDIVGFDTDSYYLGNLIVSKRKDDKYEVIDGQQRLTALYILLAALKVPFESSAVSFEYRKKSDETLGELKKTAQPNWHQDADENIISGFKIVSKRIGDNLDELRIKLASVKLVRVIVPPNTDLNKYFEIMNNRGEQLEQQDIVKSLLIGKISNQRKRDAFARVWNACSDMNGYIQMNFTDTKERDYYFGEEWDSDPYFKEDYYLREDKHQSTGIRSRSINEIADNADIDLLNRRNTEQSTNDSIVRFESFVTFRHFLLHVLKIFEAAENKDDESGIILDGALIDDKKLIERFILMFPKADNESEHAERFGLCLLTCRFWFDNYMLKREFTSDIPEGKWSLKSLKISKQRKYRTAYYVDVEGYIENLMLQSMFRVTYTAPQNMHWITKYLSRLYFDEYDSDLLVKFLVDIARLDVQAFIDDGAYSHGLNTLNIVFNFLDYILWKESGKVFSFEFRNSVEHWYPQNPIDSNVRWDDYSLNHFGNICIVSSGLNSKFSNNLPLAKKANFRYGIESQSLKLQIMSDKTQGNDAWTEEIAIAHGEEMIEKLKSALAE